MLWGTNLGDSISVNGVDLTAKYFDEEGFIANVMPETYRRSNLSDLKAGDLVNLERSLQLAGRVSGHLVRGVVEATGTLDSFTPEGEAIIARFNAPPEILRYIVMKGPVAIDGISLTVMAKDEALVLGLARAVHAGAHEPAHAQAGGPDQPGDGHHRSVRRCDAGGPAGSRGGIVEAVPREIKRTPVQQELPQITEQETRRAKGLATIEEAIEEYRNGRSVIIIDDEDRENEGDLTIPAQFATPEAINFMARYGRGLICVPMTGERLEELHVPMMVSHNDSHFGTPFSVSVEARAGVTTGISAADRARTIQVLIDPKTRPNDLVMPGHIFPLRAREGGVLVRAGPDRGDGRPLQDGRSVPGGRRSARS